MWNKFDDFRWVHCWIWNKWYEYILFWQHTKFILAHTWIVLLEKSIVSIEYLGIRFIALLLAIRQISVIFIGKNCKNLRVTYNHYLNWTPTNTSLLIWENPAIWCGFAPNTYILNLCTPFSKGVHHILTLYEDNISSKCHKYCLRHFCHKSVYLIFANVFKDERNKYSSIRKNNNALKR